MGTVAISYSSIKDASSEAKSVARKLDDYADELVSSVYNKLNRYKGEWTGNISSASTSINNKVNELRTAAGEYETYAADLKDLRDECKNTDKTVKSRISSLTASFKEDHGIRNSKVEYAINYFLTSAGNSSAFGRWLGEGKDWIDGGIDYVRQSIKDWFNYEGGKQFIKGAGMAILDGVIAIAGLVAGMVILFSGPAGWALVAAIAGVVGGAIGLANAAANFTCECIAYHDTNALNDPASGRRTSELNKISDVLREWTDSKLLHGIGIGLDLTEFVCTVINVVDGVGDFMKKGIDWLGGMKNMHLRDLRINNIMTNMKNRFGNMRFNHAVTELGMRISIKDGISIKGRELLSDFLCNLKNNYWNFTEPKLGRDSVQNIADFAKDILSDGLGFNDIETHILSNGIGFFRDDYSGGKVIMAQSFENAFTLSDFNKLTAVNTEILEPISNSIVEKFSGNSGVNISVPDFHVPEINITLPEISITAPEITTLNAS